MKRAAPKLRRAVFPCPLGQLAVGVAAAFTRDPAPWVEPPSFAAGCVSFALAAKTEIALGAETVLAAETALADKPALAGNPTVLFALFGKPMFALTGDPTVLYTLFSEPTLALALRYVDGVRTRELFCRTAEWTTSALC